MNGGPAVAVDARTLASPSWSPQALSDDEHRLFAQGPTIALALSRTCSTGSA